MPDDVVRDQQVLPRDDQTRRRGTPLTDVPVSVVQGGVRVLLGTVSGSGERYTGSLPARVPVQAAPGAAEVTLGHVTTQLTVLP